MGEIAEMMLEGLLDEETGELIDGEAPGYPRRMSEFASGGNEPRSAAEQARRTERNRRKRARQKANKAAHVVTT